MLIKPTPQIFKLIVSAAFLFAVNLAKAQFIEPENELLWEISGNGLKTKKW